MKTNVMGDSFIRTPKSEDQSEKKPRIAKELKRVQEKSIKRMKRAFNFCDKVQEILKGDSNKYMEFLWQLYMYSRGDLDLTEFLNLLDDKIRANERLMFRFDDFLESCEESGHRSDLQSLYESAESTDKSTILSRRNL